MSGDKGGCFVHFSPLFPTNSSLVCFLPGATTEVQAACSCPSTSRLRIAGFSARVR